MKQKLGRFDWNHLWEKNKLPFLLALVGLLLIGVGLLSTSFLSSKQSSVEILPANESARSASLFVDLEGAVERPGLYELPADSRINDLLIRAGGLSASADREWVEKNLNLAQRLTDGIKIYVPSQGELTEEEGVVAGTSFESSKININTASKAQLDSLWGIGEARATAIIEGRPYQEIEELKKEKIIPSNVYEQIKDQITVF